MFEFHDIDQNSDEWFAMRGGRLTSSKLGVIMANYGKAFGEPAKKYAQQIAVEQLTGKPIASKYKNDAMERGHEQEPIARRLYESETFSQVSNGGFFCSDKIGCSPDGLVNDDGVVEIKSAEASMHYARTKRDAIDPQYKWQCYGNLLFTGRKWLDFISFCDEYPEGKRLYVYRILASESEEYFEQINIRSGEFLKMVSESKKHIETCNYFNQK